VLEVNTGVFDSHEDGPPEDDQALASIQRASFPALANLPQFAAANNPLGLIPKATWGNFQSSGNADWIPNVTYDNRWPITGHDTAFNINVNLTHNRGSHTFKAGAMRERENFGQARSGTFAGEFNFSNDAANPNNTGFAFSNALLGQVTSYTESMGRPGDNRQQNTYAWFVQDTWKPRGDLTVDIGLRMYRSGLPYHVSGESSVFAFDAFDPKWGGNPPVLFRPITTSAGRRAVNPLTGEVVPVTFIGQMIPGTGYTCGVITPTTPCRINGVVNQENNTYTESGFGFFESPGIQYDPRFGMAWSVNSRTVMRVGAGQFHEGSGGFYVTGGPAYRFDRVVRFTDFNSFFTGTGTTTPTNVSGTSKVDKRTATIRYNIGIQRDLGWHTLLDVAYVGDQTHFLPVQVNYNAIPFGARFLPQNRDLTVTPTAANPAAMPDVFLRPIPGFGDISITEPIGNSRYNSLQTQLTRRFTGGIELAGSYTWQRGYQNFFPQNLANNNNTVSGSNIYQNNPIAPFDFAHQQHPGARGGRELHHRPPEPRAHRRGEVAAERLEHLGHQHIRDRQHRRDHVHDHRQLRVHRRRRALRRRRWSVAGCHGQSPAVARRPHHRSVVRHQCLQAPGRQGQHRQHVRQQHDHAAGLQQPRPLDLQELPDEGKPEDAVPVGDLQPVRFPVVQPGRYQRDLRRERQSDRHQLRQGDVGAQRAAHAVLAALSVLTTAVSFGCQLWALDGWSRFELRRPFGLRSSLCLGSRRRSVHGMNHRGTGTQRTTCDANAHARERGSIRRVGRRSRPTIGRRRNGKNESHKIASDSFLIVTPPPDAALRAARRIGGLCVSVSLWFCFPVSACA
jgi:hypothetical protein